MEQTGIDIKTLLAACTRGSADDFKLLYEHLVQRVFTYVRYRVKTNDDALDLTQDVFIDLHAALAQFTYTSTEQFYAFVFTITKRKLARYYGSKHQKTAAITSMFNEEVHTAVTEDVWVADTVARALAKLDEKTREIIVLHHWSRYTFKEIAALINMTESAVRVRHHRALATLSAFVSQ